MTGSREGGNKGPRGILSEGAMEGLGGLGRRVVRRTRRLWCIRLSSNGVVLTNNDRACNQFAGWKPPDNQCKRPVLPRGTTDRVRYIGASFVNWSGCGFVLGKGPQRLRPQNSTRTDPVTSPGVSKLGGRGRAGLYQGVPFNYFTP